jgi:PAS domain S-box-containing protein
MFLLIVVATLNSLRFFSQSRSLQIETTKYRAVDNLDAMARLLKTNPAEWSRSSQFRDLVRIADFEDVELVETELLQHGDSAVSKYADSFTVERLRNAYSLEKEIVGAISSGLPATISQIHNDLKGEKVRTVAYHFASDKGEPLTLLATTSADAESRLQRFSDLNTLFQLLSVAAAFTIAILLLKITLKPYQQIKSEALAADVPQPAGQESVDFAVQTFQRVIGELRRKEAVLQRLYAQQKDRATSLERYNEYILASMPSGVISCDTEGTVTRFNRAAEGIFNVTAAAAIGHDFHYALADYAVIARMISVALAKGEESALPEIELHIADGRRLWLSLNCVLLRDSDVAVKGAMVLVSDLTALKRLEAEVSVKEQMAALGEMAAGLAHQLRNSLAAVVGFAQLLQKLTVGTDRLPEIVVSILKEAQTTEEMLTRFLKLSRSEEVSLREVEFAAIREIVENHFAEQAHKGRTRLVFAIDGSLPTMLCDPILIGNALINLIQNSIEASQPGSEVRVDVESRGQGESIEIRVIDHGKGIPAGEIDRIFLPFFTSGKTDGTGLGLSLVRKWVICHGGEITCRSAADAGTVFSIQLPQNRHPASADSVGSEINLAKV